MPHGLSPEVQSLVAAQLETGIFADENEVLLEALHALMRYQEGAQEDAEEDENEDDWPAIKAALDGIADGTNKPMTLEEAFADIRKKHGLSS